MAAEVERYPADEPVSVYAETMADRLRRWRRRHVRTVGFGGLTAAVSVLLVVLAFAVWWAWRQSHFGSFRLSADQLLTAELLGDDGRPVVPAFRVPTDAPVTAPRGRLDLRVRADGVPSTTIPVAVEAHRILAAAGDELDAGDGLDLPPQADWLFPPVPLTEDARRHRVPIDLGDGADLILLDATAPPAWPEQTTVRLRRRGRPHGRNLVDRRRCQGRCRRIGSVVAGTITAGFRTDVGDVPTAVDPDGRVAHAGPAGAGPRRRRRG